MTALSGCAKGAEETDVTGEERAPLSVETPAYLPRALIDRNGYGTGAEKITITIGIQEDGYMRLVMNGAESGDDEALTIFLSRVLSEEEREQLELEMQEQQDAEGDNEP